jgi:type I restriction enzyme S subunit
MIPPGYKQTEVGVIPEEWEVKSVGELAQIKTGPFGTLLKASEYSGSEGVPLISVGEVGAGKFKITEHTPLVPLSVVRRLPQYLLRTGDVVFGRKGAVERSALVTENENGWFLGSDGISVRPQRECHSPYLACQFQRFEVQSWLLQNATGTTMASLNQAILSRVQIPYAPLPEQRAIATALSDVDALLAALDRLIAKKRDLKQAAMQQLLTGQTRLPGFHGDWEIVTLGEILILIADYTANGSFESLRLNVTYFQDDNYAALVRTTDLEKRPFSPERFTDKKGYDFLHKTSLVGGEIVIANVGSVGKAYRVPCFNKPMTLAPNTYLLRFDQQRVNDDYISQWMQSQDFVQKMLGKVGSTTLLAINKDNLRSIVTTCPPHPEQTAIASVLREMDGELAVLEQRRDKTRALKQGMMQELLTGRTRLVASPQKGGGA